MQPSNATNQYTDHKSKPRIEIDYARYEALLDDPSLSAEDRRAFLDVVWNIMVEFVSLGFGVHPLQQCGAACGEGEISQESLPILSHNEVHLLSNSLTTTFDDAALLPKDREQEGIE